MATLGTRLYTLFFGRKVGVDEFGNRYYCSRRSEGKHIGRGNAERRWVIYKGMAEPTSVPPTWFGWLHHMNNDIPFSGKVAKAYNWERDPVPNLTGTSYAYLPPGHPARAGKRDKATGDYSAWKPE